MTSKWFSKTAFAVILFCGFVARAENAAAQSNVAAKIVETSNTTPILQPAEVAGTSPTQTIPRTSSDELNRRYVEILEKTNQQLSLWWNPMSVFIGALGVLFTMGAIVVAVIIYRQGSEYKQSLAQFTKTYSAIIDRAIQEKVTQLETFRTTIDSSIKELKEQKQSQTTTEDNKKQIADAIANLERAKKNVVEQLQRPAVSPEFIWPTGSVFASPSGVFSNEEKYHRCSKCGFGFKMASSPFDELHAISRYGSQYGGQKSVACPSCGNIDLL